MEVYKTPQPLSELEKRKGGYFSRAIESATVNRFKNGKQTRFACTFDNMLTFSCGLNHLGDGNFFIILSTRNVNSIGKKPGDLVAFQLREDPNPLGVAIPEVLTALLEQDAALKQKSERLTDGKKRSLVHVINRIKNMDKQVQKTIELLHKGVRLRSGNFDKYSTNDRVNETRGI